MLVGEVLSSAVMTLGFVFCDMNETSHSLQPDFPGIKCFSGSGFPAVLLVFLHINMISYYDLVLGRAQLPDYFQWNMMLMFFGFGWAVIIHLPWKHSSSGYPYPQQTCSEMLGDKTPVFNASFVAPCCEISYSFEALIMSVLLCLHSDGSLPAPREFLPLKWSGIFGICFQAKSTSGMEVNDAFAAHFISYPRFEQCFSSARMFQDWKWRFPGSINLHNSFRRFISSQQLVLCFFIKCFLVFSTHYFLSQITFLLLMNFP